MNIPFATFVPMHNEIRTDLDAAYSRVKHLRRSLRSIVVSSIVLVWGMD